MTVVFDGSIDAAPAGWGDTFQNVKPWAAIQAKALGRVSVSSFSPDSHKWVRIECRPGDWLNPTHTGIERAQLIQNGVKAGVGAHRFVAWRTFYESYAVPINDPLPFFNISTQFVAATIGQSPLNLYYSSKDREFQLQVSGGSLAAPTHRHFYFGSGLVPQGHTLDFLLEFLASPNPAQGFVKLDLAVDGAAPANVITKTACATMYSDGAGLWPNHCIYRHPHPETDVIHVRPMLISDSYADCRAYFGNWPLTAP